MPSSDDDDSTTEFSPHLNRDRSSHIRSAAGKPGDLDKKAAGGFTAGDHGNARLAYAKSAAPSPFLLEHHVERDVVALDGRAALQIICLDLEITSGAVAEIGHILPKGPKTEARRPVPLDTRLRRIVVEVDCDRGLNA